MLNIIDTVGHSVEHDDDRLQILERMRASLIEKITEIDAKMADIKRDIDRKRSEIRSLHHGGATTR